MLCHEVKEVLRPPDREGRDQDVAAAICSRAENGLKLIECRLKRTMIAIAVGALQHHEVCLFYDGGIVHHRRRRIPKVAAEHELAALPVILEPQLDDRRSEDVPRIIQPQLDAGEYFLALRIFETFELAHD